MNESIETIRDENNKPIRKLIGYDDGQRFEVKVPLRIKTVKAAIDWLRPKEVPEGALRQGEFFFVKEEPEPEINDYVSQYSTREVRWEHVNSIDLNNRHCGNILVVWKRGVTAFIGRKKVKTHSWVALPLVYAWGIISHEEHGELDLGSDWHRVIPNKVHGPFRFDHRGID